MEQCKQGLHAWVIWLSAAYSLVSLVGFLAVITEMIVIKYIKQNQLPIKFLLVAILLSVSSFIQLAETSVRLINGNKQTWQDESIQRLNAVQFFGEFGGFWLLASTFWSISVDLEVKIAREQSKSYLQWLCLSVRVIVWILLAYCFTEIFNQNNSMHRLSMTAMDLRDISILLIDVATFVCLLDSVRRF